MNRQDNKILDPVYELNQKFSVSQQNTRTAEYVNKPVERITTLAEIDWD